MCYSTQHGGLYLSRCRGCYLVAEIGVALSRQAVEVSVWCSRGDGLKGDAVTKRLLVPSVLRSWLQEVRRGFGRMQTSRNK